MIVSEGSMGRAYRQRGPAWQSPADHILELVEEAAAFRAFVAGFQLAELFEQRALFLAELGRGLDRDFDHQVTASAALQHGHARAAMAQLLPDWIPAGISIVTSSPSRLGISIDPPSAAAVKLIGTRVASVVPSRWKIACGFTWRKI